MLVEMDIVLALYRFDDSPALSTMKVIHVVHILKSFKCSQCSSMLIVACGVLAEKHGMREFQPFLHLKLSEGNCDISHPLNKNTNHTSQDAFVCLLNA